MKKLLASNVSAKHTHNYSAAHTAFRLYVCVRVLVAMLKKHKTLNEAHLKFFDKFEINYMIYVFVL